MRPVRAFPPPERGPFRVAHLRPGDLYELSDGHSIVAEPSGPRHGKANLLGAAIVASDPAVEAAAIDVGFALDDATLRAPDVAVGRLPEQAGFVVGAPALAVEYVEAESDERDLARKITQLLGGGTLVVWVVRLGGVRWVEVHRPALPVEVRQSGEWVAAPGILRNPVPVDALYEAEAAHAVVLHNELERLGYHGLDAVRAEGRAERHIEGRAEGIEQGALGQARMALRAVLQARGVPYTPAHDARIAACDALPTLAEWLRRAATACSAAEVFEA